MFSLNRSALLMYSADNYDSSVEQYPPPRFVVADPMGRAFVGHAHSGHAVGQQRTYGRNDTSVKSNTSY